MNDHIYKQFAGSLLSLVPDFPMDATEIEVLVKEQGLGSFICIADEFDIGISELVDLLILPGKEGILNEKVKNADTNRAYMLNCPDDAKDYFKKYFAETCGKEYFAVAYLDSIGQVIKTERMTTGTIPQAPVYPQEIFKEALFLNASAVVLAHNHHSGNIYPSEYDIEVTGRVKQGMELMGLKLYDHIIIGGNQALSLLEIGKIPDSQENRDEMLIGENAQGYKHSEKPPSIKQQLAFAEGQVTRESRTNAPQRKPHDRGDR